VANKPSPPDRRLRGKHQGNPLYFGLIWPAIVARGWQFVGAMAGDLM
jgi:hypothetical protein